MKLNPSLLLVLLFSVLVASFVGCLTATAEVEDEFQSKRREDFLKFINSAYQVDGKYYLSGCSHWSGGMEREIKQGDSFLGRPDHHCGTTYTVDSLHSDSIFFSYKIDCFQMYRTITKGNFSIPCQKERKLAPEILFEGEKIDSFLAKKHLAQGKIYYLQSIGEISGYNMYERDSCYISAEGKLGFQLYPIIGCMPLKSQHLSLLEYNRIVWNFLNKEKGRQYQSFDEPSTEFRYEVEICRHEKAKRERALKAPPSGR
jgi:hypothetical protein